MARTYDYHPPPRDGTNFFEAGSPTPVRADQIRKLDFHKYQLFTVLDGSGDSATTGFDDEQLQIDQTSGSGPLYDTWLVYQNPPSGAGRASGINLAQIGDFLAIGDFDHTGITIPDEPFRCFHLYVIRDILSMPNEQSGEFRVEWMRDGCTERVGDQSPVDGCWNNSSTPNFYGGTCTDTRTILLREVNMPFFILD